MSGNLELIYVADAMCSWCWGFAPSLDGLRSAHPNLPVRLVAGGLRPGAAARPLDGGLRDFLRRAWGAVHERSGQPFAWEVLDWPSFVYDTEPAARAQLAVRAIDPDRELLYFGALQKGFYAEARDITSTVVQLEIARSCGIDAHALEAELRRPELGEATRNDYRTARRLGVQGFPTLIHSGDGHLVVLAADYASPQALLAAFEKLH